MFRLLSVQAIAVSLALGALFVLVASGGGSSGASSNVVRVEDDCDPETFNTVGFAFFDIPDLCQPDSGGGVSFGRMLDALIEGGHGAWSFHPDSLDIKEGEELTATNIGGEDHSFTEVSAFGQGVVPELNLAVDEPGEAVPAEDPGPTFLGPGDTRTLTLDAGTHLFQCLIHPWMRTTVQVQAD